MSRAVLCLVAVSLSVVPAVVSAQAPARDTSVAPTGTAVIRGRVVVAGSERGLSKVEVSVTAASINVTKSAMTDAEGRYEVRDLPAGRYAVSAFKPNYLRSSFGERRPFGAGQPIDIADGAVLEHVDVLLQRGGVVTGRIVDEFGDPLPDVQVMPMRMTFSNGGRRPQPSGSISITNDLGEFRLFGLSPGQYLIGAVARSMNGPADTTDRSAYTPTYYPGTASVSDAQRFTVAAGQTIASINMGLLAVTVGRLEGSAVDSQGRPMAGGFVNVMQRVGAMGFGNGGAPIKPDGTFSVTGLPPGEYTVRAAPAGGGNDEAALATVTVSSGETTTVQLAPTRPMKIRGRVVGDDGAPLPSTLAVSIAAVPTSSIAGIGGGGFANAKADGTFEISGSGGHLRMNAFVSGAPQSPNAPVWRAAHVRIGDDDVIDTGFDAPSGAAIDNIVIEMTTHLPEIDVTIVDAGGKPVRDGIVIVFPSDPERWSSTLQRDLVIGRPAQDGIQRARVPAGSYLAVAFDDPEANIGIFADPELLSQLRDRATPIQIGERETKPLELKLVEPPVY